MYFFGQLPPDAGVPVVQQRLTGFIGVKDHAFF